jgi:acetylornithine deacetylase/succinyl-diaminopimelate desuccinylase-like protein
LCGQEDGWDTEPFVLTEKNGKLYGRGATDDKGPVLGWIHALQAYQECGIELPVNFKFCFEGMEESGSEGLDKLLMERYSLATVHLYFYVLLPYIIYVMQSGCFLQSPAFI